MASDERTAKAREQELKAREFREHGEWMTTMPANYPVGESSRWEDRYAAAYAASAIKEAREECARAVCLRCRDRDLAYPAKLVDGQWTHSYTSSTATAPCLAAPIWKLGER